MSEEQKAAMDAASEQEDSASTGKKAAFEASRKRALAEAEKINSTRTGVGTRIAISGTRGKNPVIVSFEQFNDSLPATLPKTIEQFVEVTEESDPKVLVDYLIRGYNDARYEAASDPLAEFVVSSWDADVQLTFRTAVRNYSKGLGISLEDAVNIIRPGFVAKFGE